MIEQRNDSAHRRGLHDFGIEPLLAGEHLLAARLHDEPFNFRKSIEHHGENDFADAVKNTNGEGAQELELIGFGNQREAVWLLVIAGEFGQ